MSATTEDRVSPAAREKAKDRIRKLMEMTAARGCTPGEADAAAEELRHAIAWPLDEARRQVERRRDEASGLGVHHGTEVLGCDGEPELVR